MLKKIARFKKIFILFIPFVTSEIFRKLNKNL